MPPLYLQTSERSIFIIVYFPPPCCVVSLSHSLFVFSHSSISISEASPQPRSGAAAAFFSRSSDFSTRAIASLHLWLPPLLPTSRNHNVSGLSLPDFVRLVHRGSAQLLCFFLIMWRRRRRCRRRIRLGSRRMA